MIDKSEVWDQRASILRDLALIGLVVVLIVRTFDA